MELRQFLHRLWASERPVRLAIIRHLTAKDCAIIRQAAYNVLFNSSITIRETDRRYMNNHISMLRTLASRRISAKDKRRDLEKKQSFLKRLAKVASDYLEVDDRKEEEEDHEEIRVNPVRSVSDDDGEEDEGANVASNNGGVSSGSSSVTSSGTNSDISSGTTSNSDISVRSEEEEEGYEQYKEPTYDFFVTLSRLLFASTIYWL